MSAGKNCIAGIWRWAYTQDDAVGGANPSGSFVYSNLQCFFQEQPVEQLLLQQGLETPKLFRATVQPGTVKVREGDELEVLAPSDFEYYGERFRVIRAQMSSHNARDPRNYRILTLARSERAHEHQ